MKRWWLDVRTGQSSQWFFFFWLFSGCLIGLLDSVMSFVGYEYGLEKKTLEEDVEADDDEA